MPSFPFIDTSPVRVRGDPLGPPTLNQLHLNVRALDELMRAEHFADGRHNALEIPWVLGHLVDGSPPTGYLLDTAFGGSSLSRPGTGEYTIDVASGVVSSDLLSRLRYSAMANVCGSAIESKPHLINVEATSATSFKVRTSVLSSALGAGDTWAATNVNLDFGLHAEAQTPDASALISNLQKRRGDFLTEVSTDWNALVENQGKMKAALDAEHTSTGRHLINRIAKAVGWFRWDGSSYSIVESDRVSSVSKISTGVVEVTMADTYFLTALMACFPEAQPATTSELVVCNGRGFSTSTFRFYLYAFDGTNWARADRSFASSFFGVLA